MCALTDRDLRLLALLHDVKYLSTSQLLLLGWGRNSSYGARRLKLLHDSGYVDRFRAPAPRGSFEWIHRLTTTGWEMLVGERLVSSSPNYTPAEIHSIAYVEHDLQINGLVLSIAGQAVGKITSPMLEMLPFVWQGRSGRVAFTKPMVPADASPTGRPDPSVEYHRAKSLSGFVEPDATLRAFDPDGLTFSVLIELDRTRRPSTQVDRLRRYDRFLLDGWRYTRYATDDMAPVILYVSLDARASQSLVTTAGQALTAWEAPLAANETKRRYPGREAVLFASIDCLMNGDWRMLRAGYEQVGYPLPGLLRRSLKEAR